MLVVNLIIIQSHLKLIIQILLQWGYELTEKGFFINATN